MRHLLTLFMLTATACAADNLIVNGDFSSTQPATAGAFFGWNDGDPAHITLVTEGANAFARNATGVHVNTWQDIVIQPGWKALKISARIRVKGLERTGTEGWMVPSLQFLGHNADKHVVGEPKWTKFVITADQDWTDHSELKLLSADMKTVRVSIETFAAKGTFDFDDITATPVTE
jgi:hypothetical protein